MIHTEGGAPIMAQDYHDSGPGNGFLIFLVIFVALGGIVWYILHKDAPAVSEGRIYIGMRVDSAKCGALDSFIETRYYAVESYADSNRHSVFEVKRDLNQREWKSLNIVR